MGLREIISKFLTIFILLSTSMLNARSTEIKSLDHILSEPMDSKTLVVWDLHYTLVEPKPFEFWYGTYDLFKKEIDDMFLSPLIPKGQFQPYLDYLTLSVDLKTIDKSVNNILRKIESKGSKQIGLTKMKPGSLGEFESSANRTMMQLKPLGLKVLLGDEKKQDYNYFEKNGDILFVKKGKKFDSFLEWKNKSQLNYEKIIIIDDSASELDEFVKISEITGVQVKLFLFQGKKLSMPDKKTTWIQIESLWKKHFENAEKALNKR